MTENIDGASAVGTVGGAPSSGDSAAGSGAVTSLPDGDVCSPGGFRAAGVHCGLKYRKPDLALLLSDGPAAAAGSFTTNRVQAAPVRYSRKVAARGRARAMVVNSANANACTGERGERDTEEMARLAGRALGVPADEVLVASTGVIGVPLPMERVRDGIRDAADALERSAEAASRAILTTDRRPKTAAARFTAGGHAWTVGGMAKGAGMIHPRMATTLAFLTTDAPVPGAVLGDVLQEAVNVTFNRISVDGETSTNDAVLALANGASGGPTVDGDAALDAFRRALTAVARSLALDVVRDGEGATTLVRVSVTGAEREEDARAVADRLATSPLVKTAVHGGDPNWGRIVAATGSAGVDVDPSALDVWLEDVRVVEGGTGVEGVEEEATRAMAGEQLRIRVDLGAGDARHHVWTCDLTEEYVQINGSYTS